MFQVTQWRMAPAAATPPDPNQAVAQADMNSWSNVRPGAWQNTPSDQWALYRATFVLWKALQRDGGTIRLRRIEGRGSVWLDGRKVADVNTEATEELALAVPPGAEARTLTLILQAGASGRTGLGAPVVMDLNPTQP